MTLFFTWGISNVLVQFLYWWDCTHKLFEIIRKGVVEHDIIEYASTKHPTTNAHEIICIKKFVTHVY
jgi:hypothetical protein